MESSPISEPGTTAVAEVLDEGARRLSRAGVGDPRREALRLWSALVGVDPGHAWLRRTEAAPEEMAAAFRAALARRARGEPEAYIVAKAWFRHLELFVDRRVLIPRPETEGLVQRVLDWGHTERGSGGWGEAVDVGTGSGCIALSLAAEGRFDRVVATDVSPGALEVAAHNLRTVAPGAPVELRLGPGLEPLGDTMVDVVVCNPPYVARDEYETLDRGVRDYEPREALCSGADGLAVTRQLLAASHGVLKPRGLLAIEIAAERGGESLALARRLEWSNARIEEDLFGRPRFLLATKE